MLSTTQVNTLAQALRDIEKYPPDVQDVIRNLAQDALAAIALINAHKID